MAPIPAAAEIGRLIDIGGRRLFMRATGQGTPAVVFDAALAGSSISWVYVQPRVERMTRAISYDRGGFGESDPGPLPRTAGRIADELRTMLDRAGEAPPFVLVGHSYGGLVMRIFAARYRAHTAALVLVDPAHPEDWVHPAPKEQALIDRGVVLCRYGERAARVGVARVVSALVDAGAITMARRVASLFSRRELSIPDEQVLTPFWKLPPAERRLVRRFWVRPRFYQALGSQIATIATSAAETLEASAGGFGDLPLITISSTNPGDYRLAQQDALAALSTRGRHIVAPNSTHWIPLDEPEVVVGAIGDVLEQTRRAGRT